MASQGQGRHREAGPDARPIHSVTLDPLGLFAARACIPGANSGRRLSSHKAEVFRQVPEGAARFHH